MGKIVKQQTKKISGSFDDIVKASVSGNPKPKGKKQKKKNEKSK